MLPFSIPVAATRWFRYNLPHTRSLFLSELPTGYHGRLAKTRRVRKAALASGRLRVGEGNHPQRDILSLPYREQDPEGETTLEAVSAAPDFNRWMYESVARYMISPVLEIGSGIGNISAHVLGSGHETYLSDL